MRKGCVHMFIQPQLNNINESKWWYYFRLLREDIEQFVVFPFKSNCIIFVSNLETKILWNLYVNMKFRNLLNYLFQSELRRTTFSPPRRLPEAARSRTPLRPPWSRYHKLGIRTAGLEGSAGKSLVPGGKSRQAALLNTTTTALDSSRCK